MQKPDPRGRTSEHIDYKHSISIVLTSRSSKLNILLMPTTMQYVKGNVEWTGNNNINETLCRISRYFFCFTLNINCSKRGWTKPVHSVCFCIM